MERWQAKVTSLFLIFGISLVANLLPIKLAGHFIRQGSRGVKVLSCLMCFGGGVFFATYMLHLAPEVNQIFQEAIIEPYNIHYPLSELTMVLGFFMILFLEYFVHAMGKNKGDIHLHSHSPATPTTPTTPTTDIPEKASLNPSATNGHTSVELPANGHVALDVDQQKDVQIDIIEPTLVSEHRWTRSLLLLLALSLHHVFEGIGVGLQDSQGNVWSLCIAIISHEVVIAFSFGLQLVKAYDSKLKIVLSAVLCNGMTPVGIIIGTVLIETTGQGSSPIQIANGVLQALSTGVFIYVTFFEILQAELSVGGNELSKLVCMLLGVLVLSLLVLIPEDMNTDSLLNHDSQNSTILT